MCVGLTVVRRRFVLKKLFTKFLIVSVVMLIGLLMLSANSGPPPKLGVNEGKLTPCPESPNCVSTQSDSQDHKMEPITWKGTREVAVSRIKETISRDFPGAALVEEGPGYLRYEFRSLIFRFVDDVEFYVVQEAGEIHFRSASRVGLSDLGANKFRMKKLVEGFYE